ncbi:MAG: hypothetical protein ACYYK0_01645 [Candidatus Eutrophobiaceae bacterium]
MTPYGVAVAGAPSREYRCPKRSGSDVCQWAWRVQDDKMAAGIEKAAPSRGMPQSTIWERCMTTGEACADDKKAL